MKTLFIRRSGMSHNGLPEYTTYLVGAYGLPGEIETVNCIALIAQVRALRACGFRLVKFRA